MSGHTLFSAGEHRNVMFDDLCFGEAVQANQHLIVHGNEAMLLDPGGSKVFRKGLGDILGGAGGAKITTLFMSHQDPDIVAAINGWLISTDAEAWVSALWTRFVPHFGMDRLAVDRLHPIPDEGMYFDIGGCELMCLPAHFLHSCGNFQIYDPVAKALYSGDLGASLGGQMPEVTDFDAHIPTMAGFHRRYMTSRTALRAWAQMARGLDIDLIVPQHGSIFRGKAMCARFIDWVADLECGLDWITELYRPPPRP